MAVNKIIQFFGYIKYNRDDHEQGKRKKISTQKFPDDVLVNNSKAIVHGMLSVIPV